MSTDMGKLMVASILSALMAGMGSVYAIQSNTPTKAEAKEIAEAEVNIGMLVVGERLAALEAQMNILLQRTAPK